MSVVNSGNIFAKTTVLGEIPKPRSEDHAARRARDRNRSRARRTARDPRDPSTTIRKRDAPPRGDCGGCRAVIAEAFW